MMKTIGILLVTAAWLLIISMTYAGSATWKLNPTSGSWNTASNWTPATVPNSPSDTATFATSDTTALSFSANVEVNGIVYNSGASAFTISVAPPQVLTLSGTGIMNNSGAVQNFTLGTYPAEINFTNSATAGTQTTFTNTGGVTEFTGGGHELFSDSSTAAGATFVNNGGTTTNSYGGFITFLGSSSAGNAVITNNGRASDTASGGGTTIFQGSATAANAMIINRPNGTPIGIVSGGNTTFDEGSTAGTSVITNEGATISGQIGGGTNFFGSSTAGNATITCNGGQIAGAGGGIVHFVESGKPGNAILIANGGVNGGDGGKIQIVGRPLQASNSRVELFGNGTLETSTGESTIGSLEGTGIVSIGSGGLSVGSNNLDTIFSGVIQSGGNLTKVGSGTLVLSGANTYTGYTIVEGGTLIVQSLTGSGSFQDVEVHDGTLGGGGTIPTFLLIQGTPQTPAILAPAAGGKKQTTLTVQGLLWFVSDGSSYTCTFRAKGSRVRSDLVIANGVRIDTGTITLQGTVHGTLPIGLTLTLISNSSADPITGTFTNLPDGAVVTIAGNNFQANYEGGDGNDLTLTVVP